MPGIAPGIAQLETGPMIKVMKLLQNTELNKAKTKGFHELTIIRG